MSEIDLVYSQHCKRISSDGKTVQLEIYGTGKNDWFLEVVDEHGNSTCWDEPSYRSDPGVAALSGCRRSAIADTTVYVSERIVSHAGPGA